MVKLVDIQGIHKLFGETKALRGIDLQIADGEFVALLGPSGCGKTTLLRLLAGFETPTKGRIDLHGEPVADSRHVVPPEQRRIGMVFQSFALWPHMTVYDNVLFPLQHQLQVPAAYRRDPKGRVLDVLEMVGLAGYERRYPQELSGGQKQRVGLARSIVFDPVFLLMDEPLSSLDAGLRVHMRKSIHHIHRHTGSSVLYVTHDQSEALAMADRIVVMKNGRIEQIGTPEEIYFRPQSAFVATFVGKANLLRGQWTNSHTFTLDEAYGFRGTIRVNDGDGKWAVWREKGLFPVRPEQVRLLGKISDKVSHGKALLGRTSFDKDSRGKTSDITSSHGKTDTGHTGHLLNVRIPARIKHVQFQGKEMLYTLQAGQTELESVEYAAPPYERGDEVWISFDV